MAHKTLAEMKAKLMQGDEFRAAYEAEVRKERLQELLAEWRSHAGLNSADVAARMGIAPSTLSRMEKISPLPVSKTCPGTRGHAA